MSTEEMQSYEVIGLGLDLLEMAKLFFVLGEELNDYITGTIEPPDPMMVALRKVQAALDGIEDFALAAWATARSDNIAFLLAHTSAALQTVNAFLQSGATHSDAIWSPKLALADRDSLIAVHTFTGDIEDGFWLRPESIKAISWAGDPESFSSGWMGHMPDRAERDPFNRVWDYRWGLPAAIYAISNRLIVLKAIGAAQELFVQEVSSYNSFIARVFRKMESGIRSLDTLSEEQINRIPTHGLPIAVADIYGGYYVGGQFHPLFPPHVFGQPPFPPELPELPLPVSLIVPGGNLADNLNNAKILTRHFRNHVSITIGLPLLLRYSGGLENLLAG